jgi:PPM family protein phosphatase
MFLEYATTTHQGRLVDLNRGAHTMVLSARLFAIADGVTEARGGRASALAVETLADRYRAIGAFGAGSRAPPSPESSMRLAFAEANARLWSENLRADPLRRMGTTLVAMQFCGDRVVVGSVGDSRCYRLRDRRVEQLTRDHILLEESRPHVTEAELEALEPLQSVLSRMVGNAAETPADVVSLPFAADDAYLLCSRGLWDALTDEVIEEIVREQGPLQVACDALVRTANASCGRDNLTVTAVRLGRPDQR